MSIETLYELLSDCKVEIPIIQRDYAQGRKDSRATAVRTALLENVYSAITGQTKEQLDLNFVYGKTITGTNKTFIPIDGQQRLTTLFLLHLFAFREDKSKTDILKKFSYKTRVSSRDFFKKLICNRAEIFSTTASPSVVIADSSWFLSGWHLDPTIQSVLTMLDAIFLSFKNVDDLASLLVANDTVKPIIFRFFDDKDLGMEDNLYIKLNARGKPLTDLENFKAKLVGRIHDLQMPIGEEFEIKFDKEWTEFFWSKKTKEFDQKFFAFFEVLLLNHAKINESKNWMDKFDIGQIDAAIIETVFYTLEFLSKNPNCLAKKVVFETLHESPTYEQRVLFHAVTTYFYCSTGTDNSTFGMWMRIIKNLTCNSTINTFDLYKNAISSITNLSKNFDTLISHIADTNNKIEAFNSEQRAEEQIKAQLILKDEAFAKEIYIAEKHKYFNGQIRSSLYLAKLPSASYDLDTFILYRDKISVLFDDTKPKYNNLLRQALLTYGDYTLMVSQFKTLCADDPNESQRTPSLKRLFGNCPVIVKNLLNDLDIKKDIAVQLDDIINRSKVPQNDWRYCLIKYPYLFNYMSVSHLRICEVSGNMLLVPNKWANGKNNQIFLAALQEELKNRKISCQIENELGSGANHFLFTKGLVVKNLRGVFYIDKENNCIFKSKNIDCIAETADFIIQQ